MLEDGESQLDEWVELQVSGETSPPVEDDEQDLETPTILWVGAAFDTAASDELQFPATSTSRGPAAQESNSDTEVIESDAEDVLESSPVPSSKQTHVSLKESQFLPQVKPPSEEEEAFGVKGLEKLLNKLKLPVDIATPVIYYSLVNEGTTVSRALDPEPETVTKQSPTLVEEAEGSLDLLQDSQKISKDGDFPGADASEDFSHELFHSTAVSETTSAAHNETEKGNSEADQDACSSFQVLDPIEEPISVQGTLEKCCQRYTTKRGTKQEII